MGSSGRLDKWADIIAAKSLDLAKDVNIVTARDIKRITGEEARLMANIHSYDELPSVLKAHGLFVLPVKNGVYALVRGNGYHTLEEVTVAPEIFYSRLDFDLVASKAGSSEMQYIDHAFNSGLLEYFAGIGSLRLSLRGRKYTPPFQFRVGKSPLIQVRSVQIECDGGFEGKQHMVVLEAKVDHPQDFLIKQLYYPFRYCQIIVSEKEILPMFLCVDMHKHIYTFWRYRFLDAYDYESIDLVESRNFVIVESPLAPDELAALPTKSEKGAIVPQADDIEKVLELPLLVAEGLDNSVVIAVHFGFDRRQSSYYREAAQALGLVTLENSSYILTDVGRRYVQLPANERNELVCRLLLELPVMNEVLVYLLSKSTKRITKAEVASIIERISHLSGTTPARRAQTVFAWFRWIEKRLGIVRVGPQVIRLAAPYGE